MSNPVRIEVREILKGPPKVTQRELARRLRVTERTIANTVRGKGEPSAKLARALGFKRQVIYYRPLAVDAASISDDWDD